VLADALRCRPAQLRDAEFAGYLDGVDPVCAGREHEQRRAVGVEDQRVGDLPDLDAQRRGRRGGGGHRLGEHDDPRRVTGSGARPGRVQRVLHRPHIRM
jgi:hypothetical protein